VCAYNIDFPLIGQIKSEWKVEEIMPVYMQNDLVFSPGVMLQKLIQSP
jgi:hypothetical protein